MMPEKNEIGRPETDVEIGTVRENEIEEITPHPSKPDADAKKTNKELNDDGANCR